MKIKNVLTKSGLVLFVALAMVSCSKDDDAPKPEVLAPTMSRL